ncbi:hypothetical protein Tco_1321274 [Tanacetum coccineum]
MDMCTKLSDRVLDLENVKNAQALEIQKLKKRFKKLESKKKSRNPQLKRRLFKVRIESSAERKGFGVIRRIHPEREEINFINYYYYEPVILPVLPVYMMVVSGIMLSHIKSEKSKAKGVTMQDPSESGTRV